jgi:Lar family restriction alleviation protein
MTEIERLREALLPCPFCGGNAAFQEVHEPDSINDNGVYIECSNAMCGATTQLRFGEAHEPLAEMWNRRAALAAAPPVAERDEALRPRRGFSDPMFQQGHQSEHDRAAAAVARADALAAENERLRATIKSVGGRARSDGGRTFDDTIRDLMLIDDICRASLSAGEPTP